jgi:thiosulfate reductase cytochrome b subunit
MALATDGLGVDDDQIPERVYRHRLPTRLWHWINVAAIIGLFMSGLMIFNAHPRLYWGHFGANPDPAWLEIGAQGQRGYMKIGAVEVTTTGVLGRSSNGEGGMMNRAFPRWITLPGDYSLAVSRHWHLGLAWAFAVGYLLFFLWALIGKSRHAHRDLGLRFSDLSPAHLWQEIKDHARLRFPHGLAALRYNGLQKISYFAVIFILIPMMIFTGLAMSPGMDAGWPWIVDVLGGRQTARSLHFIVCWALFGFFVVHILMVVLAGPVNELRSMLTGWYHLPKEPAPVENAS